MTTFKLTKGDRKPRSINDIKVNKLSFDVGVFHFKILLMNGWLKQDAEFEDSFHNRERVYGRVLWHPSNEL